MEEASGRFGAGREDVRDPFQFEPESVIPEFHEPVGLNLHGMTLVGIITGTPVPKAMFPHRDGFGHILSEGTLVLDGVVHGRISDIRDEEVEITLSSSMFVEAVQDVDGDPASLRRERPSTRIIRLDGT